MKRTDGSGEYTIESAWPYDGTPYQYVIPENVSPGQYFIKISQGSVYGKSPDFVITDSAAPTITVTSPVNGEKWYKNITHLITWTRTEDIADTHVRLDLFDAPGTTAVRTIETDTKNDGFYKWVVDEDLGAGTYTLRVKAIGEDIFAFSSAFSINDTTALVLTSPRQDVEWYRNVPHLINWYRDEAIASTNVALYLYDETGTSLVKTITSAAENSGSFEWTVDSDITDGSYLVRIETIDGLESNDSGVFTIAEPGNLVVTVPYGCEEWVWGETYTLSWYRDDTTAGVDVNISLYNALGTTKIKDIICTENDGTFEWMIDGDIAIGDYSIKISTVDETEEDYSNMFTISLPQGSSMFLASEDDNVSTTGVFGLNKSFLGGSGGRFFKKVPLTAGGKFKKGSVSEKNSELGYNNDMALSSYGYSMNESDIHGPNIGFDSSNPTYQSQANTHQSPVTKDHPTSSNKTLSTTLVDTYYIWSHDGKLLAEYDQNGNCVKDYIYIGNKLLAEYHPQTGNYYYHMQDQINSTRIVIDDDGNVVYSAAHGPFGDIQKEWVTTYDPKQKFSGKERENYSDLDYFGGRYYDNHSYRFLSVDPVRNKDEAIGNPQLWNLYTYCNNNPITNLDPDGRDTICSAGNTLIILHRQVGPEFAMKHAEMMAKGYTETIITYAAGVALFKWAAKGYRLLKNAKLVRRVLNSKKAYNIAKFGGRHAGQLKRFLGMSKSQLNKSIASFERNIAKHKSWIKNPSSKISNWNNLSSQHQSSIIHHWNQDIKRAKELKSIAQQVLNK